MRIPSPSSDSAVAVTLIPAFAPADKPPDECEVTLVFPLAEDSGVLDEIWEGALLVRDVFDVDEDVEEVVTRVAGVVDCVINVEDVVVGAAAWPLGVIKAVTPRAFRFVVTSKYSYTHLLVIVVQIPSKLLAEVHRARIVSTWVAPIAQLLENELFPKR
jgi:hypothetical protein